MSVDQKIFTNGAAYERLMGQWSRLTGTKFLAWLDMPKGLRGLDAGCGNGAFTETLLEHGAPASVDAIDPAEAQIAYAKAQKSVAQVKYQVADAQALPFDNAVFDAAAMALVISFIPDPAKAIGELARVVCEGGLVATYMWDGFDGVPVSPFSRAAKALGFGGEYALPSPEADTQAGMRALWQGAGLEAVETCRITIPVTFKDFDDFWQSCTAMPNPAIQFMRGLSDADVKRLRAWLQDSQPADAAGRINYTAAANAVKGRVKRR